MDGSSELQEGARVEKGRYGVQWEYMQELSETVLGVISLDGSRKLEQNSRTSNGRGRGSLRDGKRRAAGGSSIQR
jgi:hypothetical protein